MSVLLRVLKSISVVIGAVQTYQMVDWGGTPGKGLGAPRPSMVALRLVPWTLPLVPQDDLGIGQIVVGRGRLRLL
jgi:hypothetical protein